MKHKRDRQGAAAVEFAIIAPLLFMLLLAFIELSRGFMVQQVLTNASRVGARQAITVGATQSETSSAVQSYTSSMGLTGSTITITPNPSTASSGDEVTVTVSIPYASVTWLPVPKYLAGKTLTASSVMRKEGFD